MNLERGKLSHPPMSDQSEDKSTEHWPKQKKVCHLPAKASLHRATSAARDWFVGLLSRAGGGDSTSQPSLGSQHRQADCSNAALPQPDTDRKVHTLPESFCFLSYWILQYKSS
ncbi:hypothetical protein AV530_005456 [Patagioenas fasciata monilis]|uniref:Uncharacterized protein n=1 Tax=Patagioenas fasciata monilis TaxID=372326 RepID=A0A1V4JLF4_PATFA|nr:hypothetical protein AV530_005456 [Patagioenas fasciata monilis]